jgi:glycosyltransferase involved in cell wall biosynthesis
LSIRFGLRIVYGKGFADKPIVWILFAKNILVEMDAGLSNNNYFRFAIASSCQETWGGCEELWAGAAALLSKDGHHVKAFKTNVDVRHNKIIELESIGCSVIDLNNIPISAKIINRFLPSGRQYSQRETGQRLLQKSLASFQPHLSVVSQGVNFDGVHFAEVCRKLELQYVMVAHKAVDFFFPPDEHRSAVRSAYQSAVKCFFVSQHNLDLTQEQIGVKLSNAQVVFNPFAVPFENHLSWARSHKIKLACVARLFLLDKGQDNLLRVLSKEKWRQRDVEVTFFGEGADKQALIEMARLLDVQNIKFAGHVRDITEVWKDYHALVLPSRSEGLPLTLVEAMLCGRPAIVANAGGSAEIVEDNITGFIANAPTAEAFDEALERAWTRRHEWEQIGERAAECIRKIVPFDPTAQFAKMLLQIVSEQKPASDFSLS